MNHAKIEKVYHIYIYGIFRAGRDRTYISVPMAGEEKSCIKENHLAADGDSSVPVSVQQLEWGISGCFQPGYHYMEAVHF